MATPQPAIFNEMGRNQWYVHLSRVDGADLSQIKGVLRDTVNAAAGHGLNLCVLFGPTLLADLGGPAVDDFQPYETFVSADGSGREAKGTQEELLLWWNGTEKDMIWEMQFNARTALAGNMTVARETPTFVWRDSWDMTGFVDGTGNPEDHRQPEVALIPRWPSRRRWLLRHRPALGPRPRRLQCPAGRSAGGGVRPQEGAPPPRRPTRSPRPRTWLTSSCVRTATTATRPAPSGTRSRAAPRPTPSTTARSGCTSWPSAAVRLRCASA